ncbi:type IV secretory system conjugative DNA transfer family protein [Candidatus Methylacidiphilum infernorum]|uniref:Type IV secretory pathway, VirD4 component n=1 Tax=Methylacidiphilum infernorum (isolate V4) TaxID=481448 RepID=B3DV73_METI4|nr:type IV secretory system conjugative DNA transfer family protein [Candidatus Methylacidiphilum infernorum]ACD83226.1 Type IV secretory pathway, VirD4 component [Methylacidiphilum infernorum V4]
MKILEKLKDTLVGSFSPQHVKPKLSIAARTTGSYWPREPISLADFGKLYFRVQTEPQELADESGKPLMIKDLFSHVCILGGSGAGKTRYVLTQFLESLFRATDLRNDQQREELKFAGFIMDGKCELTEMVKWLAKKYDREKDILYFGPDHDLSIDPFNNPDSLPSELADLMITLKQAIDDGRTSQDPFWDAAGRKLFNSIFQLHRELVAAAQKKIIAEPPPPLSFPLLNLLVMDRGLPANQNQINSVETTIKENREKIVQGLERINRLVNRIDSLIQGWKKKVKDIYITAKNAAEAESEEEKEQRLLKKMEAEKILKCLSGEPTSKAQFGASSLSSLLEGLRSFHGAFYSYSENDQFYENFLAVCSEVTARLKKLLKSFKVGVLPQLELWESSLSLIDEIDNILVLSHVVKNLEIPAPEYGPLQKWLGMYEKVLRHYGKDPYSDEVYLYFKGEYLNLANERTSGSIGMTVSVLTSLMTQPPFDRMVSSQGNLNFRDLIDEGKILVLDMNFSRWRNSAKVASILLKLEFFRSVLSRKQLKIGARSINQKRPVIYLCDEFATVATTGDWTGERGFFDKAREYQCGCIIAFQSLALLESRMIRSEIEAILTNTATVIFLRNPHFETNEYASRLFGEIERSDGYLYRGTQELLFDLSKPIAHQDFQIQFRKEPIYPPYVFSRLKDGEAIVKLHPRFGKKSIKRVQFLLHLIPR